MNSCTLSLNKTVTYDSTYGTLPTATKTGYTFDGWYTSASGGTKIEATSKVSITSSQTLYAHWTASGYTVTFNANGGTVSTASKTVTYDSTYGTLPTATKSGHTFNGWYTSASGGTKIETTTKVTITSSQTLYAQWTQCGAGKYSNLANNTCDNCTAGTYSTAGAGSCTNCEAGTYSAEGASGCAQCEAGKYSVAGSASCTQCTAGTYSATGAGICTNCEAGTYSAAGASSCTSCAAGTYNTGTGNILSSTMLLMLTRQLKFSTATICTTFSV